MMIVSGGWWTTSSGAAGRFSNSITIRGGGEGGREEMRDKHCHFLFRRCRGGLPLVDRLPPDMGNKVSMDSKAPSSLVFITRSQDTEQMGRARCRV